MLRFRLLLVVALAACSDIAGLDRLVITVAVNPDHIAAGGTTVITVRITNPTATAIEVPDYHCSAPFEIANGDGDVVAGNEPIFCTLELRPPTVLAPFQSIERRGTWNGQRRTGVGPPSVFEPVPAGLYLVYGRLLGRRSAPDTISVVVPPLP